ncbi:unnamed protein product [Lota lota]
MARGGWLPSPHLVTVSLPGYHLIAWLPSPRLVTVSSPGYRLIAWLPSPRLVTVSSAGSIPVRPPAVGGSLIQWPYTKPLSGPGALAPISGPRFPHRSGAVSCSDNCSKRMQAEPVPVNGSVASDSKQHVVKLRSAARKEEREKKPGKVKVSSRGRYCRHQH